MAEKKVQTQFYQVKAPFYWKNDTLFTAGMVVEAGHPVLKGRADLFTPLAPISHKPSPAPAAEPDPVAETEAESAEEPEPAP